MGITDIKTPRETVGRLKYEIDHHGLRPTTACQAEKAPGGGRNVPRQGAYCRCSDATGRSAPETVSGGPRFRDVIAPSGLPDSSH